MAACQLGSLRAPRTDLGIGEAVLEIGGDVRVMALRGFGLKVPTRDRVTIWCPCLAGGVGCVFRVMVKEIRKVLI